MKKSGANKVLAGVCGGIGDSIGMDPSIVRLLFVGAFLLYGMGLGIYLILWLVMD